MTYARRNRRGVVLMVALAVLTLFTMIVISFLVVATTENRSVKPYINIEATGAPPRDLANQAFLQLVRGSADPRSPLGPHSLGEDVYGNDSVVSQVQGFGTGNVLGKGSAFYFDMLGTLDTTTQRFFLGPDAEPGVANVDDDYDLAFDNDEEAGWPGSDDMRALDDYYTGRVITMITGEFAGKSSRIIRYQVNAISATANTNYEPALALNTARFWVIPFDGMATDAAGNAWTRTVANGDGFVINGAPFSGTGFGAEPTTAPTPTATAPGRVDALFTPPTGPGWGLTTPVMPHALLPNRSVIATAPGFTPDANYSDAAGAGGADEDYDAPDFQNLHLAGMEWDSTNQRWHVFVPSFHRPELLNYWRARHSEFDDQPNFRRMTMFRPDPKLHFQDTNADGILDPGELDFSGKQFNPANLLDTTAGANLLTGPWDVDNDGNGVADSVWIDLGFPAQVNKDGRLTKPLFAFLVLDQDGRLNLNAHGSPAHYATGTAPNDDYFIGPWSYPNGVGNIAATANNLTAFAYGGTNPTQTVMPVTPLGLGWSPADINLGALFGLGAGGQAYRRLLEGGQFPLTTGPYVAGRYGESDLYTSGTTVFPRAGRTVFTLSWGPPYGNDNGAGIVNVDDDRNGTVDDPTEIGWPGSDDLPTLATRSAKWPDDNRPLAPQALTAAANPDAFSGNSFGQGFNAQPHGLASDFRGDGHVALDYRGQPMYGRTGAPRDNGSIQDVPEAIDEPTEIDLTRRSAAGDSLTGGQTVSVDEPFSPEDAEILYRWVDGDRELLNQRLRQLLPALFDETAAGVQLATYLRGLVTTESWDIPVPHVEYTREMRLGLTANEPEVNLQIKDLFFAKLRDMAVVYTTSPALLQMALAQLMGPESSRNEKIDINRPFGNGIDDSPAPANPLNYDPNDFPGYGTVDEPGETVQQLWTGSMAGAGTFDLVTPPNPGPDNQFTDLSAAGASQPADETHEWSDGNVNLPYQRGFDQLARQAYARQLYCMMMLLKDRGYNFPVTVVPPVVAGSLNHQRLTAYRIAQWAINCADFRDPDSIMTPFEFDIEPFEENETPPNVANGTWDVDGWIGLGPGLDGYVGIGPGADGQLGTADDVNASADDAVAAGSDDAQPWRGLVWGCESPELLLSETVAFHDRRTEDLDTETPDPPGGTAARTDDPLLPDPDFDQRRMPQGSAFVELYCTMRPTVPRANDEIHSIDSVNGRFGVDLERLAPPDMTTPTPDVNLRYPVWRLAVTENALPLTSENNFAQRRFESPDSITYETGLGEFDLLNAATQPAIERIVWLGRIQSTTYSAHLNNPALGEDVSKLYYNRDPSAGGPIVLQPGEYAVIGPYRRIDGGLTYTTATRVGFVATGASPPPLSISVGDYNFAGVPSLSVRDNDATALGDLEDVYENVGYVAGSWIKPAVGIPVAGTIRIDAGMNTTWAGWAAEPDYRISGFNISEPLLDAYYPAPATSFAGAAPGNKSPTDADGDVYVDVYAPPLDLPVDLGRLIDTEGIYAHNGTNGANGTETGYKTVILQRLADPTRPYHLQRNPYRTVDWMPIDLTVFNGMPDSDPGMPTTDPMVSTTIPERFWTREREGQGRRAPVAPPFNIWQPADWTIASTGPQDTVPNGSATAPFKHNLVHTLGFLNSAHHETPPIPDDRAPPSPQWRNATAADAAGTRGVPTTAPYADYIGDPIKPFPWITWNNRDYASALELMFVPATSNARLVIDYDIRRANFNRHFEDRNPGVTGPPFGYLLNFFHSSDESDNPTLPNTLSTGQAAGNFHRLFEYVHVPSRFSGTRDMLNPAAAQDGTTSDTFYGADRHPLSPPYNYVSRFREPGKVNLNTMTGTVPVTDAVTALRSGVVLDALLGRSQDVDTTLAGSVASGKQLWEKLILSRRGYTPDTSATTPLSPSFYLDRGALNAAIDAAAPPSFVTNPFRSFSNSFNVPVPITGTPPAELTRLDRRTDGTVVAAPGDLRDFVEGTVLRADPEETPLATDTGGTVPSRPMFAMTTLANDMDFTYAVPQVTSDALNTNRNPYFRYQLLQKLANTTTTRSNVYAVWITVGHFEVERVPIDVAAPWGDGTYPFYPDGYRIVREVGSDTGEIRRSRAFYLHDRTIPVGFIRGENLNVMDGVLLERIIE